MIQNSVDIQLKIVGLIFRENKLELPLFRFLMTSVLVVFLYPGQPAQLAAGSRIIRPHECLQVGLRSFKYCSNIFIHHQV